MPKIVHSIPPRPERKKAPPAFLKPELLDGKIREYSAPDDFGTNGHVHFAVMVNEEIKKHKDEYGELVITMRNERVYVYKHGAGGYA